MISVNYSKSNSSFEDNYIKAEPANYDWLIESKQQLEEEKTIKVDLYDGPLSKEQLFFY